jgi:hypothetical protein
MAAGRRLSPGLWIAAAAEIAVAFVIATIILDTDQGSSSASHADMHAIRPARIDWETTTLVLAAITAGLLTWWLAPDVSHVCRSHAGTCQTSRATTNNPTTSNGEPCPLTSRGQHLQSATVSPPG